MPCAWPCLCPVLDLACAALELVVQDELEGGQDFGSTGAGKAGDDDGEDFLQLKSKSSSTKEKGKAGKGKEGQQGKKGGGDKEDEEGEDDKQGEGVLGHGRGGMMRHSRGASAVQLSTKLLLLLHALPTTRIQKRTVLKI